MIDTKTLKNLTEELNVIYVEDEEPIRISMADMLRDLFKEVRTFSNGLEGLDAFKERKSDIVITDVKMPVMDGLTMLEEIKKTNGESSFIIITAYGETAISARAMQIGVDGFILKPLETAQLFNSLYKSASELRLTKENFRYKERLEQLIQERTFQLARSNEFLRKEIMERKLMEKSIEKARDNLEITVMERTAELREANKRLRMEVGERKKAEVALCRAKERAEEATRLKDKFVSLVAHDLRAPFNSLLGYLNIMAVDKEHPLSEKHRRMVNRITESGQGLLNMIHDLLNITNLQTGKIKPNFKFFDGYFIAKMQIAQLSFIAQEKGIKLINEVPHRTRLYADMQLIGEVIQNLVSNAVKFCKQGDRVTIFVHEGKGTSIAVNDTGVGVSEQDIPNLFRHEIKTSATGTAGEKGTGLGLPYSHDIMKAHGGDLTVESTENKGSTFYIKVPYVRPRVMVADDFELDRKIIIAFMKGMDVEFLEAVNGKEAIAVIKKNLPHLIISDLMMPVLDGLELLEYVRKTPLLQSIPFIMLTESKQTKSSETAFRKGANDFITKPVTPECFIPRVRRFVV